MAHRCIGLRSFFSCLHRRSLNRPLETYIGFSVIRPIDNFTTGVPPRYSIQDLFGSEVVSVRLTLGPGGVD